MMMIILVFFFKDCSVFRVYAILINMLNRISVCVLRCILFLSCCSSLKLFIFFFEFDDGYVCRNIILGRMNVSIEYVVLSMRLNTC